MQISVRAKQVRLGDGFRTHIAERLEAGIGKYFDDAIEATVQVAREAHDFRVDCAVHVGSGISAQAHAVTGSARDSFEAAVERLEKQLRRHKRYLRDHHRRAKAAPAPAVHDEAPAGPMIIAETGDNVATLSVGAAARRLGSQPALLFKNGAHGGLNLVYRRVDGNIGWIDPFDGSVARSATKAKAK
jgi:ribosomal subunit interface protein